MEADRDPLTEHFPLIQRVIAWIARRQRLNADDTEELTSIVYLKLVEDDYAILRKFRGHSSLATYLTTVITRIHLDHRTSEWGKWRPSLRARALGATAVALERLTIRDGLSFDEASEILRTNHRIPESDTELDRLQSMLPRRMRRRYVGEQVLRHLPAPIADPEPPAEAPTVRARLSKGLAGLPDDDRVLLRLRFREGWTIARIARTQGLDPKLMYRRFERIYSRLRSELRPGTSEPSTTTRRRATHPRVARMSVAAE